MNKNFLSIISVFLFVSCNLSGVETDGIENNDTLSSTHVDSSQNFSVENHEWSQPDSVNGKANDMVFQREDGLRIEWTKKNPGPTLTKDDLVLINFEARFAGGDPYDGNKKIGYPIPMRAGMGMMVKGFEEGFLMMHVGDLGRIMVPNKLGYGEAGYADLVPPNMDLIIEIEIVEKVEPIVLEEGVKVFKWKSIPEGKLPEKNQNVTFNYFAYTVGKDGKMYDNSFKNGEPYTFRFKNDNLIEGLHQGIGELKEGEKAFIEIPAKLAYGDKGLLDLVPPKTTVVYDVRVISIE